MAQPTAIVLLSGGLDSATVAAVARGEGFRIVAMSFRYGQRHALELEAARHVIAEIDLRAYGGSALTADIAVPKHRGAAEIGSGIPVTYVPARNTIFLAHALALAEVEGAQDIFIGVNALDYSGYPDCRPEYVAAFQAMARLATKAGVETGEGERQLTIHAPLQDLTKAGIVELGTRLGVDFARTFSCYDPPGGPDDLAHCGTCDACQLRRKGFEEAGIADPTRYAS